MPSKVGYFKPSYATPQPKAGPSPLDAIYSTYQWKKFRAMIRRERNGLCEDCRDRGRVAEGTTVHHAIDPRDDPSRTFDPTNVRLVCAACHNAAHGNRRIRIRKR